MRVEMISYLKKNVAGLELNEPMVATQEGKPAYVIEAYADRVRRAESIALVKLPASGSKEYEGGKRVSSEQLKEGLQQLFGGNSK